MDQFDSEEQEIERQYNDGEMSLKEYNKEMRELQREYRAYAEEAAQEAHDREMERW